MRDSDMQTRQTAHNGALCAPAPEPRKERHSAAQGPLSAGAARAAGRAGASRGGAVAQAAGGD